MTKRAAPSGEGNSGEWYLALIGAGSGTSGPPTTLRDLPPPPAAQEQKEAPAEDQDAAGSTGDATESTETHTAELVGRLWDATGRQDPLEGWAPEELSPTIRSRRNFRWTVITVIVLLGIVAWALVAWLPSFAERRADARAAEYVAAVGELRTLLPDAQQALADVTDPADPTDKLGSIVERITNLETAADEVRLSAAEPLPSTPPLVPSGAIDDLEPIRDRMAMIGVDGSTIADRISTALSYRTVAPDLLQVPDLPLEAGTETANQLSVTLAGALADSVGLRSQLGDDPAFAAYTAELDTAIARFGEWQAEYIDALRRDDQATATELVTEMTGLEASLEATLFTALADLRSGVDQSIITLAQDIEALQVLIPG